MAKYAYARVLQKGQSLNKQLQAFSRFGIPKDNVFVDDKSGMREAYGNLIQMLKKGDLLVIKTLNALNDGYENISSDWVRITDMPALDTRAGEDRKVIVAAVTQVLNYCAEKEKTQSALQAKGIESAKQRGVKFGRPPKQYSNEFIEAAKRFKSGEITMKQALVLTGMKQSSFYYHIHKMEELKYFS